MALRRGSGSAPDPKPRSARELIETARAQIVEVGCQEAVARLEAGEKALVLIDVREEHEHDMVRLGGSVHVARGSLEMVVEHDYPDRDTPMILYCAAGDRSALAAATLQEMGYRNVSSLRGGLHAWRDAGFPVLVPAEQRGPGSGI